MLTYVGPVVETRFGVNIRATDGRGPVVVQVTAHALEDRFACRGDYAECAEVHAEAILTAARRKYDGLGPVSLSATDF